MQTEKLKKMKNDLLVVHVAKKEPSSLDDKQQLESDKSQKQTEVNFVNRWKLLF